MIWKITTNDNTLFELRGDPGGYYLRLRKADGLIAGILPIDAADGVPIELLREEIMRPEWNPLLKPHGPGGSPTEVGALTRGGWTLGGMLHSNCGAYWLSVSGDMLVGKLPVHQYLGAPAQLVRRLIQFSRVAQLRGMMRD